ncbi:MAG TPA: hypothetical protein VF766_08630, partial [Pyrinomonadaceae bacterium]
MKRSLTIVYLLIISLSFGLLLPIGVFAQTPATSQTTSQMSQRLVGLQANVTVRRDERGIPYIEA